MNKNKVKTERRNKIRQRIRSVVRGTAECPRLTIFKSNKNIYLQLIDDLEGKTLISCSSKTAALQSDLKGKPALECAAILGGAIAKIAKDQGLKKAVFDRSGYKYHGIVKAAAEGAREGGLDF